LTISLNAEHKKSPAEFSDRVLKTFRNILESDNRIPLWRYLDRAVDTDADLKAL